MLQLVLIKGGHRAEDGGMDKKRQAGIETWDEARDGGEGRHTHGGELLNESV